MTEQEEYDVKLEEMTYELMQPLLNDVFKIVLEQGAVVEITLVEVERSIEKKPALHSWQKPKASVESTDKRAPFALVFRFPVEVKAAQGNYRITHPNEGAFEGVFLAPIAADEDGLYLEAVFS